MRLGRATLLFLVLSLAACPSPDEDSPFPPREPAVRLEVEAPREPTGEAIELTLRVSAPDAATHFFEVEAWVPALGDDEVELMMPVWTPGSYLVREYSRNVESFVAHGPDGDPLPWAKTNKNRWTIETGGADRVGVRYRLYAADLSVRTPFVDDEVAIIVGAGTFVTRAGDHDRPHDLRIEAPDGWRAVTALPAHPDGSTGRYLAVDYDELVDSPIVIGEPLVTEFSTGGAAHSFATFGDTRFWDQARAARDVEILVQVQQAFWGVVPYREYTFLNVLSESGGGGLEHERSTLMLASLYATRDDDTYHDWLGLVSHEFFHTWNGKRLRPVELGPFDYEQEVYTRALWIVEGITSYYDDVMLARAGIIDAAGYLERLSKQIHSVQTTPGRHTQPLADASFDAWIKFYRWDENSVNSSISYYRKGALVGFLLDAMIRRSTAGQASLDDVMRRAYTLYSGEEGFTVPQFRAVVAEVARTDLAPFFDRYVDGTDELDFEPALAAFGLRFEEPSEDDELTAKLGADTRVREGRVVVAEVRRDTPAFAAGLVAGDEVIAIDGRRVQTGPLDSQLGFYEPGDAVLLLVSRRGRVREVPVTLGGEEAEPTWRLVRVRTPTTSQRDAFRRWIGPRVAPPASEPSSSAEIEVTAPGTDPAVAAEGTDASPPAETPPPETDAVVGDEAAGGGEASSPTP